MFRLLLLLLLPLAAPGVRVAAQRYPGLPKANFSTPLLQQQAASPVAAAAPAVRAAGAPQQQLEYSWTCVRPSNTSKPGLSGTRSALSSVQQRAVADRLAARGLKVRGFTSHTINLALTVEQARSGVVAGACQYLALNVPRRRALDSGEGSRAMLVDRALQQLGAGLLPVNGSGVRIGILSDSFAALPRTPSPCAAVNEATILADYADGEVTGLPATDEGRAMAELVCFVAPGAQLFFHTAYPSEERFAQGIIALQQAGCQIIIDDIGYLSEPYHSPGVIAQAVETVHAAGAAYFSAAGNWAGQSWEGSATWVPGPALADGGGSQWHAFDGAATTWLRVSLGDVSAIIFQWDEPYARATGGRGALSDLDVWLCATPEPNAETCSVGNVKNIGNDAVELFGVDSVLLGRTAYLGIRLFNTTRRPADGIRMKAVWLGSLSIPAGQGAGNSAGYSTDCQHANVPGALSVGAANWRSTPGASPAVSPARLAAYSSYGATTLYLDRAGNRLASPLTLQKPDVVGPDGTATSFFDPDADGQNLFFGTSAAAPHAAALAALMLQLKPALKAAEIYAAMRASALDMGATRGWDRQSGYGYLSAVPLLALAGPQPTPSPEPVAASPSPEPEPLLVSPSPSPEPLPVSPTPVPEPVAASPEPVPEPVVASPEPLLVSPSPEPQPAIAVSPSPAPAPSPALLPKPVPSPVPGGAWGDRHGSRSVNACARAPDGTRCDDGNDCTTGDVCRAGVCVGSPRPDGSACDAQTCTRGDQCAAGVCRSGAQRRSWRWCRSAGRSRRRQQQEGSRQGSG